MSHNWSCDLSPSHQTCIDLFENFHAHTRGVNSSEHNTSGERELMGSSGRLWSEDGCPTEGPGTTTAMSPRTEICCKTKVGQSEHPLTWEHHPPDMPVPHPAQTADGVRCARIIHRPQTAAHSGEQHCGKTPTRWW